MIAAMGPASVVPRDVESTSPEAPVAAVAPLAARRGWRRLLRVPGVLAAA